MERLLRRLRGFRPLEPSPAAYQPVPGDSLASSVNSILTAEPPAETHFSWFEYGIFTLLGIAMLWAW
jgi:solute carrier family 29 (equilibrative nucleoside transporter), member 1/2/3